MQAGARARAGNAKTGPTWKSRADAASGSGLLPAMSPPRHYPIGAELLPDGGAHFRVWAPNSAPVAVELLGADEHPVATVALEREASGYHAGIVPDAAAGSRYRFRLPQGSFPDPGSRFQPSGPHGPSEIVDPHFEWTDAAWRGRPVTELVLYEMHVGTFTPDGTWQAAMAELPELARIGITALEIMPIADFPGGFGWGYDGVNLFAPTRLYGRPDDVRAFVNRAHELGMMVILDVVYNHLGPDGCYLQEFSPHYFTTKYECEWGQPLNFDGEESAAVREYFVANAHYWIAEFHFDGLRLDATQQIFDASEIHVVAEIAAAVRAAAPKRQTFVVGENEPQEARLLRARAAGGCAVDALWNDDFHHAAMVAATGKTEAYYGDYRGSPQEFVSACKYGYLFQGQWSQWQQQRRGTPALDLTPQRFVSFLQNHDQVANSLHGFRLQRLTSPGMLRALTAVLLLSPSIPLLFQGQEFAASAPFLYFADHKSELAPKIAAGRRQFLAQFRSIDALGDEAGLSRPNDPATFRGTKLDHGERRRHRAIAQLHEDLLRLRREQEIFRQPQRLDGAVLGSSAFVLRFFSAAGDDRLLLVNLGRELHFNPAPEPLLAPTEGRSWRTLWSSEALCYDGGGTPELETSANWIVPGPASFVLSPHPQRELPRAKLSQTD